MKMQSKKNIFQRIGLMIHWSGLVRPKITQKLGVRFDTILSSSQTWVEKA